MPSVQRIANSLLTCTALLAAIVAAFEEHDHEKRNMIGKRDLSDQRYYTLAIIHATGEGADNCACRVTTS